MATTPQTPAPRPTPSTDKKDVPLPHMPPKPADQVTDEEPSNIPENTSAEQAAGKAAIKQHEERINAEQAAGAKASGQAPKRT